MHQTCCIYYASEVEDVYKTGRLGFFPVDPAYPVNTAWDIGASQKTDSIAVVFTQDIGPEIRVVDHFTTINIGVTKLVQRLEDKRIERGFRYGTHTMPHDVATSDLSTGASRLTAFAEAGLLNVIVAPKVSVSEGRDKVRKIFPKLRFDKDNAQEALDALQNYRRVWDPVKGDWSTTAFHGPESHTADSIRYMATTYVEKFGASSQGYGNVNNGDVEIVSTF